MDNINFQIYSNAFNQTRELTFSPIEETYYLLVQNLGSSELQINPEVEKMLDLFVFFKTTLLVCNFYLLSIGLTSAESRYEKSARGKINQLEKFKGVSTLIH